MVQIIKPSEVRVVTKQGECTVSIALELNINLNTDGINVTTKAVAKEHKVEEVDEVDEVAWAIPDFTMDKIKFGKHEGG